MQRKRQQNGRMIACYLRLPSDIKARLDAQAELEGVSQARLVVKILSDHLENQEQAERVGEWLDRIS